MPETTNGTVSLKPDLGRFGVWTGGPVTPEEALDIEQLGYGALWVGASPAADLSFVEPILEKTDTLQVATGIVNIWSAPADEVAESYHRIESAFPGRFLLGVGVGHPEHTQEYVKPYDALVAYLDALDAAKVPTSRRVIAALGPRVLKLARDRSAGAHPYLTTPEHTAQARELVGNTVFLAPEHKVALTRDAAQAREIGPPDRGLLPGPVELRQQLAPAGLHRQRRRQTRQRQPDRRGGRARHARLDRGPADRAPRRRRRPRRDPGARRPRRSGAHPGRVGGTAGAEGRAHR